MTIVQVCHSAAHELAINSWNLAVTQCRMHMQAELRYTI